MQVDTDHVGREEIDRLPEHGRFRFDSAHAPGDDAEPVDHRRVRVGADQRVGKVDAVFRVHAGREELEVHLVDDAEAGRDDLQPVERAHSPLEEFVARAIAGELDAHVELQRIRDAREVHLHAVVDDQIDGHQRLDELRGLARGLHRVAHRRQIDDQRHAGEVLQEHARDHEGDLFGALGPGLPGSERFHVLLAHALAVEIAQERFEHDAQADRQARDPAETLLFHFGEREERPLRKRFLEVHDGGSIGDSDVIRHLD